MTASIDTDRVILTVMAQSYHALERRIEDQNGYIKERNRLIDELEQRIGALEELNAGYTDAICNRDAEIARLTDERNELRDTKGD
jgi:small-conductance mechanosensitive channel